MRTHATTTKEHQNTTTAQVAQTPSHGGTATFVDNRPSTVYQRKLQDAMKVQRSNTRHPQQSRTPQGSSRFQQIATAMGATYGVDTANLKATHSSSFPGSLNAEATIQGHKIHFAPERDTDANIKHEVAHAIDNTLHGTPSGDHVVKGRRVDTTREKVVDRMAKTSIIQQRTSGGDSKPQLGYGTNVMREQEQRGSKLHQGTSPTNTQREQSYPYVIQRTRGERPRGWIIPGKAHKKDLSKIDENGDVELIHHHVMPEDILRTAVLDMNLEAGDNKAENVKKAKIEFLRTLSPSNLVKYKFGKLPGDKRVEWAKNREEAERAINYIREPGEGQKQRYEDTLIQDRDTLDSILSYFPPLLFLGPKKRSDDPGKEFEENAGVVFGENFKKLKQAADCGKNFTNSQDFEAGIKFFNIMTEIAISYAKSEKNYETDYTNKINPEHWEIDENRRYKLRKQRL